MKYLPIFKDTIKEKRKNKKIKDKLNLNPIFAWLLYKNCIKFSGKY